MSSSNSGNEAPSLYAYSSHKERFEVDHYIIKRLGSGTEGDVYASIPKLVANPIYSDLSEKKVTKDAACTQLRAALQAVKITKTLTSVDCKKEITALLDLGSKRRHIAKLTSVDPVERAWLTTELLIGRDLSSFKTKVNSGSRGRNKTFQPPRAFGWHLIHHITTAFLELHFGIVDGCVLDDSERYMHNDTSAENIAFRYPGSFKDYPDLVIIDLGKATKIDHEYRGTLPDMYMAQCGDVVNTADQIKLMLSRDKSDENAQLRDAITRLTECYTKEVYGSNDNEALLKLLASLRDEAFEERGKVYEPLDTDITDYFAQEIATDDELLASMQTASGSDSGSGSSPRSVIRTESSSPPRERGRSRRHIFKDEMAAKRRAASDEGK